MNIIGGTGRWRVASSQAVIESAIISNSEGRGDAQRPEMGCGQKGDGLAPMTAAICGPSYNILQKGRPMRLRRLTFANRRLPAMPS
jgi:hypothetical protein